MKKLTVKGKLSLNKETIAKLNNEEMQHANGGATATCSNICTQGCPTATACTGGTNTHVQYCCIAPCW